MKRILTALLALALTLSLAIGAAAATPAQQREADALNRLGLFLGTDKGYELDAGLSRSEGVTLLVRMLGRAAEAEGGGFAHPFRDVPAWAEPYVAYAYENQLTYGYGADTFGASDSVSEAQFLTMVLRALGYDDAAEKPDFDWQSPGAFALALGLVNSAECSGDFDRGAAVEIFWAALGANCKGGDRTLAERLAAQKVFGEADLRAAKSVAAGSGSSGGSAPGPAPSEREIGWEEYNAMTGAEREAFFNSFASPEDFVNWLTAAKAQYEKEHPTIEIGENGEIDLGKLTGGKG